MFRCSARPPAVHPLGPNGPMIPIGPRGPMSPTRPHGTIHWAPCAPQGPWNNNNGRNHSLSCLQLLFKVFLGQVPKLAAKDVTHAKKQVSSTTPRPESNGGCSRPGFGQKPCKRKFKVYFAYPSNPGYRPFEYQDIPGGCRIPYDSHVLI